MVRAVVAPTAPVPEESRGHGGQLRILACTDVAPTLPGYVVVPGLSYGACTIASRCWPLPCSGAYQGGLAGGRLLLLDCAFRSS